MSDLITSQMLSDWRANYGLDKRTPIKAMHWWQDNMDGKAPAGVVAALGLCINEIERLTAELETERMRLTACGVAALANTADSAARARDIRPEYRSASLDDVERAVDREIQLRDERDELRRQLAEAELDAQRYRWLRPRFFAADFAYSDPPVCAIVFRWPESAKISANLDREIDAAMGVGNE